MTVTATVMLNSTSGSDYDTQRGAVPKRGR